MNDFTIRFNHGRLVAVFGLKDELDNWARRSDLSQEFMYTIHGSGEGVLDFEKYKKTILVEKEI